MKMCDTVQIKMLLGVKSFKNVLQKIFPKITVRQINSKQQRNILFKIVTLRKLGKDNKSQRNCSFSTNPQSTDRMFSRKITQRI